MCLAGLAGACGAAADQQLQPTGTPAASPSPALPRVVPSPTLPTTPGERVASPASFEARFSGEQALRYAAAQMEWVPRHPGTPGARACGDYIAGELEALGWAVEEQPFEYRGVACRNILGRRGSGPQLIIGAHYDTRKYADRDPDPARQRDPVPGANDGASGVAVLLELARVIQPDDLGISVCLAAFDAEDNGEIDGWEWIVGSSYMAQNLDQDPLAVVIVDMIGDADQQIYYERTSDRAISQAIWQIADELGYQGFIPQDGYSILDDHTPFLRRGDRAIDIIDFDYPYWHTVEDTLDKISAASLEAVGRTLEAWLWRGLPGIEQRQMYPAP